LNSFIKRVFALFAILFLTFLPVLSIEVHAVEPWSGNPWDASDRVWKGNPWEGKQTQWEHLPWKGNTWEGSPWSGNTWEGNPWSLEGWEGSTFEGKSWTARSWEGSAFEGNPWSSTYWNGYSTTAPNFWTGNDWEGKGTQGKSTQGSTFDGNTFKGKLGNYDLTSIKANSAYDSSYTPPDRFYDSDEFKGVKYVWESVTNGMIDFDPTSPTGFSGDYLKNVFLDTLKLQHGDVNFDYVDIGDKAYEGYKSLKELEDFRRALGTVNTVSTVASGAQTAQSVSKWAQYGGIIKDSWNNILTSTDIANVGGTWNGMTFLSKLNLVSSGISAGISTIQTADKINDAIQTFKSTKDGSERTAAVADAASSFGEAMMSYGGLAAAIPGGQAVGATMVAAGAVIFIGGKAVQLVAENWDTIKNSKIVRKGKELFNKAVEVRDKVVNKAKEIGKKAVKGVIKSIKGWFS
jgi:hypothetical protein